MSKTANMMEYHSHFTPPHKIITLGDNFYDKGTEFGISDPQWNTSWYDIFMKGGDISNIKNIKWHAILGNHDYYGGYNSIDSQIKRTYIDNNWYMPYHHYIEIEKQTNSFFIHIDTCQIYPELYHDTKIMISRDQKYASLSFIENALKGARRANARWIFVIGHYHIFSNGFYENYDIMMDRLLPLLEKYDVDAYICGHEHNFQILKRNNINFVVNGACTYSSEVTNDNIDPSVQTFFVSNNNGFAVHSLNKNEFKTSFVNNRGHIEYTHSIMKK